MGEVTGGGVDSKKYEGDIKMEKKNLPTSVSAAPIGAAEEIFEVLDHREKSNRFLPTFCWKKFTLL